MMPSPVRRSTLAVSVTQGTHRAPSTALFSDFCRRLWERHGLEKLLRKGTVTRWVGSDS